MRRCFVNSLMKGLWTLDWVFNRNVNQNFLHKTGVVLFCGHNNLCILRLTFASSVQAHGTHPTHSNVWFQTRHSQTLLSYTGTVPPRHRWLTTVPAPVLEEGNSHTLDTPFVFFKSPHGCIFPLRLKVGTRHRGANSIQQKAITGAQHHSSYWFEHV